MSLMGQTLILYLLLGLGVASAVYLGMGGTSRWQRAFCVVSAVPFWPFYVPLLLSGRRVRFAPLPAAEEASQDEMASAIAQVDAELGAALSSLEGWADDALARERERLHGLRAAWTARAGRIRAMDRLLALPGNGAAGGCQEQFSAVPLPVSAATNERLRHSQGVRQQNLERLRGVRQRAYDDLMTTLAWVRELSSMLQLARFTDTSAARLGDLLAQVAAAGEGVPEITWPDDTTLPAAGLASQGPQG